ncbi:hypothetical protein [Pseudomaricurvus hydrocarbonicus]|uniref:hypothetical protein n=1 Tax=Pseudomaricurvus hydrocarbonicus TaxID=1470433 RepID=UPI001AA02A03|nr:hypothetical protein [Aestuariicella hydrocarbonica]
MMKAPSTVPVNSHTQPGTWDLGLLAERLLAELLLRRELDLVELRLLLAAGGRDFLAKSRVMGSGSWEDEVSQANDLCGIVLDMGRSTNRRW